MSNTAPTLADVMAQLESMEQRLDQRLERLELRFGFLETRFDSIDKRKLWGRGKPRPQSLQDSVLPIGTIALPI